jgi:hypothetical protein
MGSALQPLRVGNTRQTLLPIGAAPNVPASSPMRRRDGLNVGGDARHQQDLSLQSTI